MNHVLSLTNTNKLYYLRDSGSSYFYAFGYGTPTIKSIKYGVAHILSNLVSYPCHSTRIQDLLPDVVELPYDATDLLSLLELLR